MRKVFLALLFIPFQSLAQPANEETPLFSYGIRLHQAFILVHSEDIRPVEETYPRGLELDFAWQQRSYESFNKCNCFPKLGASVQFWDFDSPDILGRGINAYFYVEPEYGASRKVSFAFRGGFGASFLTRPHDEIENPNNLSYSTNAAFSLVVAARLSMKVSPRTRIDLSPYYNHISNGGVKQPNAGINYPSLSFGLTHYTDDITYASFNRGEWDRDNKMRRLDISPFVAWKQVDKGVHVFSPGVEVKASTQVAHISALSLGVEFLEDNIQQYEIDQADSTGNRRKFSVLLGHEFLLGRILFSQQLGIYLYNPGWEGDPVYQRWGFMYRFTDKIAFGINLKAHRNVANFVDYRFSFSL